MPGSHLLNQRGVFEFQRGHGSLHSAARARPGQERQGQAGAAAQPCTRHARVRTVNKPLPPRASVCLGPWGRVPALLQRRPSQTRAFCASPSCEQSSRVRPAISGCSSIGHGGPPAPPPTTPSGQRMRAGGCAVAPPPTRHMPATGRARTPSLARLGAAAPSNPSRVPEAAQPRPFMHACSPLPARRTGLWFLRHGSSMLRRGGRHWRRVLAVWLASALSVRLCAECPAPCLPCSLRSSALRYLWYAAVRARRAIRAPGAVVRIVYALLASHPVACTGVPRTKGRRD